MAAGVNQTMLFPSSKRFLGTLLSILSTFSIFVIRQFHASFLIENNDAMIYGFHPPTTLVLPKKKQRVCILPNEETKIKGELKHMIMDGVNRSSLLEITSDPYDFKSVWVVDIMRYSFKKNLVSAVKERWWRMFNSTNQIPRPWNIYMLDFYDGRANAGDLLDCMEEIAILFNSTDYVHYATRNLFSGRKMRVVRQSANPNREFQGYGEPTNFSKDSFPPFGVYTSWKVGALRYSVRSDLVEQIENILLLNQTNNSSKINDDTMHCHKNYDITTLPRQRDVAHFWKADTEGHNDNTGKLRSAVSRGLLELLEERKTANLTIFAGEMGKRKYSGRNGVQKDYAEAMLTTKIVVVCQRDGWEDRK